MPEDQTLTVGAYLREARERAGLSVRDLAATTKIAPQMLEALERDEVARLPGGIFLRAFVRAYAREVGLDPEEAVRRFVARFPDASVEESPVQYVANPERIVVDNQPAAGRLWRILGWCLPIVLVIVYFGFGGRLSWWRQPAPVPVTRAETQAEPSPGASAPIMTQPAVPAPAPTAAEVPAATGAPAVDQSAAAQPAAAAPAEPSSTAAAPAGPFQVALSARERCWVTVRSDGKIVYTGTLNAGERQELSVGGRVSLTVGNAGGIDLALNGKPARPLGGEGQVVTLVLTADTLDSFLASR